MSVSASPYRRPSYLSNRLNWSCCRERMSMPSLMGMWIFSSTTAGGGVRGTVTGIARGNTVWAGYTIKTFPPFIERSPPTGGGTIGSAAGGGMNGITNGFRTIASNGTGRTGKKTGTGSTNRPGVSGGCNPEYNHSDRITR